MNIITTQKALDWVVGGETGVQIARQVPRWAPYLSPGESQKTKNMDTDECAIYSADHGIEPQVNYDILKGNYSMEAIDFFHAAGFMQSGSFKISKLFNAKCAGTTEEGTYMNAMGDSYRHDGLLPEVDLPTPDTFTWAEYDALVITDEMRTKAKQVLNYIQPAYQWINRPITPQDLLLAPIQIAIGVCPGWNTDTPVKACAAPMIHCVSVYFVDSMGIDIQDTYIPFLKVLDPHYTVYAAMQYTATPKMPTPVLTKPTGTFEVDLSLGSPLKGIVTTMQTFLAWNGDLDPKYICGVFGPRTLQAVKDFQEKYEYDILIPANVPAPTGKWGTYTRAKANQLLAVTT